MKSILLIGTLAFSANVLANSLEIDLDAKHFANEVLSSNKLTNAQKTSSGAIGDNDIVVSDCAK